MFMVSEGMSALLCEKKCLEGLSKILSESDSIKYNTIEVISNVSAAMLNVTTDGNKINQSN